MASGSFLPTDYDVGENLPSPATPGPYSTDLTIFGVSPNGTWKLFVSDDFPAEDGGSIEGGWCLRVTTFFDSCSTNGVLNHLPSFSETTASGPAEFYPQSVQVQGVLGHVQKVTVSIDNMSHPRPDDLDILLVGPSGESVILLSDSGGGFGLSAPAGVDLVIADNAASAFPDSAQISSGSYRPTNFGAADVFPAPAPAGGHADNLGAFYGIDPNGTWSLYVVDDETGERGQVARWCINLWVSGYLPPEMTLSQSTAGNDILLKVATDGGGYYAVDGSTNLVDWAWLESFDMTGEGIHGFIDVDRLSEPGPSAYFYRSHWTPEP
jgi:subtilisin-like proprotein convertase family protein